jgi:hypothetical protein
MPNSVPDGVLIPGVDGTTPLGYLAALGLLQVMEDARDRKDAMPRLAWTQLDAWRPVLHGVDSLESVAQLVFEDRTRWADSTLLAFRYVKQEKQGPNTVGGLRAPLAVVRAWSCLRREEQDDAALAYGAALFCDGVTEVNKKPSTAEDHRSAGIAVDPAVAIELTVERSFFDLTARNAQFLEQVEIIRSYLGFDEICHALGSGEPDYEAPRSLDWDPSSDTPGAIYTGFRRGFLPVHEWLGFRALRLFPLTNRGTKVRMTACTGRRLDGDFTWPLWDAPVTINSVRSLLGHPELSDLTQDQRLAFGISALLRADLTKKADGYTGTFAPARPV